MFSTKLGAPPPADRVERNITGEFCQKLRYIQRILQLCIEMVFDWRFLGFKKSPGRTSSNYKTLPSLKQVISELVLAYQSKLSLGDQAKSSHPRESFKFYVSTWIDSWAYTKLPDWQ